MKWLVLLLLMPAVLSLGPAVNLLSGEASLRGDWRTANRDSTGLAPPPEQHPEALVQVYGARAFGWRGAFAVHTWIAIKPENASDYTVHQVIGWHMRYGGESVVSRSGLPDRHWYGQPAVLLGQLQGAAASAAIEKIEQAVATYPWNDRYVMWPGPNSNTFTAHIARQVPELQIDLPPTAIGKDYLGESDFIGATTAGDGTQFSLFGLLGVAVNQRMLEFNILGLNFGVQFAPPGIRIPGALPSRSVSPG